MNKAAIKRFAVEARKNLMADIRTRLGFVGITETGVAAPLPSSTKEIQYFKTAGAQPASLTGEDITARKGLAEELERAAGESGYQTAYESLVETAASAWFNRLVAIRFMEVNGYFSDGIRMLSSEEAGKHDPDIVTTPFDSDLEFTDAEREEIIQGKLKSETDKVFRLLFFKRCHQLHKILPGLFEKAGDATEFLMRLSVVDADGVIYHLVHDIAEEDFKVTEGGQVEIIGWMYQYYNSELKDDTFARLKKNIKVTKERLPSATQLFTPDWIVRYMVENSLGRLWIEHLRAKTPELDERATAERFGWKYYLPEAKQEEAVEKQLTELRKPRADLKPEDIRCIDPCMGSGHILSYLFDVLMQIYLEEGYDARDAVEQIVTKNLYGLDIDDRAGQLAYFTVMMKARSYDRGFFRRGLQPHVKAIQESNGLQTWKKAAGDSMLAGQLTLDDQYIQMADELIETFHDAKEYGSLLTVRENNYDGLLDCIERMKQEGGNLIFSAWMEEIEQRIEPIIAQAKMLSQKYDVVVTNPPYMGSSKMAVKLSTFVKKQYMDSKSDLFACFMERGNGWAKPNAYNCMVTMQSWMFLSSLEKMRKKILSQMTITNLMHMENMVLGIAFGTVVTVLKNVHIDGYKGIYNHITLDDIVNGSPIEFPVKGNRFAQVAAENFAKIPGAPVAYWASETFLNSYAKGELLGKKAITRNGMKTGNNDKFLRLWHEVIIHSICFKFYKDCSQKWFLYNKGGVYRKWYGNNDYVVNWKNEGYEIFHNAKKEKRNVQDYPFELKFAPLVTWSLISSGKPSFRGKENTLCDIAGMSIYAPIDMLLIVLALLNTRVSEEFLQLLSPTLNFQAGDIANIPIIFLPCKESLIKKMVQENYVCSKTDWDSFETSWDFKRHPLV